MKYLMVYSKGDVTEDCLEIHDFDDNQLTAFLEDILDWHTGARLVCYFPLIVKSSGFDRFCGSFDPVLKYSAYRGLKIIRTC